MLRAEGQLAQGSRTYRTGGTANPSTSVPPVQGPMQAVVTSAWAQALPCSPQAASQGRGISSEQGFPQVNHGVQHPAVCPSRLSPVSHSIVAQLLLLHLPLQVRFSGPSKHAGLAGSPHLESGDLLAFQRVIIEL